MVMIESAAPNPLDSIFQDFEKKSGWTLSPQAKTILKEGLEAVHVDMLGLGDFAVAVDRAPSSIGSSTPCRVSVRPRQEGRQARQVRDVQADDRRRVRPPEHEAVGKPLGLHLLAGLSRP